MLKENDGLKKEIIEAVDEMSIKLTKSKKKRQEQLKKNIEEYDLE